MAVALHDGGGGSSAPDGDNPPSTTIAGVHFAPTGGIFDSLLASVELSLDLGQVERIEGHLDAAEGLLGQARDYLRTIPAGAVGASPVGQQLAHHSSLADDALRTKLEEMEKQVVYFRDMIRTAAVTFTDTDTDNADRFGSA